MKALLYILLSLPTITGLYAQKADSTRRVQANPNARRNGYETYRSTDEIVSAEPYSMINTIDHRYEGLRGGPYFLPEWNKGQIEMVAGQSYKDVPIKFNAYQQQLILRRPWAGGDSIVVHADQVKSFQLTDPQGQTYRFRHLSDARTDDEQLKNGYFLVMYQNKTALLKRVSKTFRPADYKNPYSNGTRYDEFRNAFTYYVLTPDQTLTKVKLTDKSILGALNDRPDAPKNTDEVRHMRVKTEADAIELLKQYDAL